MSTVFTRTLTFRSADTLSEDLGANATLGVTLLLIFDEFTDGLYREKFPICWKVIRFPGQEPFSVSVTYRNQIAVFNPQIDDNWDIFVNTDVSQEINPGQKTTLFRNDNGDYAFTAPEADLGNKMRCFNGTQKTKDMAVGFVDESVPYPIPLFFCPSVPPGSFTDAQFTPVLRAYIMPYFQEGHFLRSELNSPIIWETNLATLCDDTTWDLKYNHSHGAFTITAA